MTDSEPKLPRIGRIIFSGVGLSYLPIQPYFITSEIISKVNQGISVHPVAYVIAGSFTPITIAGIEFLASGISGRYELGIVYKKIVHHTAQVPKLLSQFASELKKEFSSLIRRPKRMQNAIDFYGLYEI